MNDMVMNSRDNAYKEIEILRGFAILAVIVLHVCGGSVNIKEMSATMIFFRSLFAMTQFAVPLFLFISGFSLSLRYENDFNTLNFYKKRFGNVIPPYLIFSIFYIINSGQLSNPGFDIIDSVIIKLLTASACIHFWYFRLLFQFYFFYPLIRYVLHLFNNRLFLLLMISVFLQIFWVFGQGLFQLLESQIPSTGIKAALNIIFNNHFLLSYISYFIFGIYAHKTYRIINDILFSEMFYFYLFPIVLIFGAILSYFHINNLYWKKLPLVLNIAIFFNMPVFLLLFRLSIALKDKITFISKIVFSFGKYSFGIYLIHLMILLYFHYLLSKAGIDFNDWFYYLLNIILTASLSLLIVYLMKFLPFHKFIIGRIRNWSLNNGRIEI